MNAWRLPSISRFMRAARTLAFAGLLLLPSYPLLAADGPFAALPGTWSGTGTILLSSGAKERIRCRATHRLGASSTDLRLELSCQSDSYKFELQSQIASQDGTISGNWAETTRSVGGRIEGRATGNTIQVRAEGQTFSAILAVTTRGDKQSISIQSPGSEMSDITITLTRGSR